MKFSMKTLFPALAAAALTFSACTKDDNCTPPAIEQNIIGTWSVSISTVDITFKADSTFVDPTNSLFSNTTLDSLNMRTYHIANDSIFLTASSSLVSQTQTVSYAITKNQCNQIGFDSGVLGINVNLNRK